MFGVKSNTIPERTSNCLFLLSLRGFCETSPIKSKCAKTGLIRKRQSLLFRPVFLLFSIFVQSGVEFSLCAIPIGGKLFIYALHFRGQSGRMEKKGEGERNGFSL